MNENYFKLDEEWLNEQNISDENYTFDPNLHCPTQKFGKRKFKMGVFLCRRWNLHSSYTRKPIKTKNYELY